MYIIFIKLIIYCIISSILGASLQYGMQTLSDAPPLQIDPFIL